VCLGRCDRGEDILDRFNDAEDGSTWIVSGGNVHDDFASQWDDDAKWDVIAENMKTQKNHRLTRKCQNLFSRTLCFCEYEKLAVLHSCRKQSEREIFSSAAHAASPRASAAVPLLPSARVASVARSRLPFNAARGTLSNPFQGLSAARQHRQVSEERAIEHEEATLENRIAAAQVLADMDELDEDDVDELEDELEEVMEEEAELELEQELSAEKEKVLSAAEQAVDMYEAEYEAEAEEEEEYEDEKEEAFMAALEDELEDEILDETFAEEEEYDEEEEEDEDEIIAALDGEVETQNEVIEDQDREIKKLKLENAMKEEMISVLEEHENDGLYDDEDDDEDVYEQEAEEEEFEEEFEADDDAYDDDEEDVQDYYEVQSAQDLQLEFMDESYNELYDVNGEDERDDENDWFDAVDDDDDDEDIDSVYDDDEREEEDLQRKEADAMLADTFWGIEVYAFAFMMLMCCCCGCYLYKTRCCGFLHPVKRTEFGYAAYAQRSGFKQVFGAVDEEEDDDDDYRNTPKIGSNHDDSDEEAMLQ